MRVSMGGYGGMVGGGGSGGMGMMEEPTLWGQITAFLDTLPVWLSTIIIAAVVILGAMFIGWIAGQIIGRIMYPNPDKPSVLNKKEKMIYAGVLSAAILLVVVMAIPKSDEDMAVNGGADGTGGMDIVGDPNGVGGKEGVLDGATDGAVDGATDDAGADSSSSSDASSDSTTDEGSSSASEGSSSSSSSSASGSTGGGTANAPATPSPAPNIAVKPVPSVG